MKRILLIAVLVALSPACKRGGREVVVYTSVDQVFSEPVFKEFERQSGIAVRAVFDTEETKSTGVLNRLIAEASSPQADVFWSGDPVRPFLLVKRGLAESYVSPSAMGIPAAFKAADGTWTGFAARVRVLLVNKNRAAQSERPKSIKDLTNPRWKGQVAIANPLFGTTTMHAAALFASWGDEQAKAFFEQLKGNGARIASSNALVIRAGPHPETGRKLVDYLLTSDVERRMADSAGHVPLRADVPVPQGVKRISDIKAMQMDYGRVATEMERIQPWLRQWVGL